MKPTTTFPVTNRALPADVNGHRFLPSGGRRISPLAAIISPPGWTSDLRSARRRRGAEAHDSNRARPSALDLGPYGPVVAGARVYRLEAAEAVGECVTSAFAHGLSARVTCPSACEVTAELLLNRTLPRAAATRVRIGLLVGSLLAAGKRTFTVKPRRQNANRLRKLKRFTVTVKLAVRDPGGALVTTRSQNVRVG